MSGGLHLEAAGHGPPLVLLHGWAMHSGVWGGLSATLARRRRVHAVDLPGHGWSPARPPFTAEAIVRSLDAAFAGEPQPLTVLGWSLGGQLAIAWALARPERVARLVLVGTTPRFAAADGWDCALSAQTLARFGDELHVSWRATVLRFLTLQMRGGEHGHAALAALRRELFARGEPSRPLLRDALALLAATDLREAVGRVAQPALVVAGGRDTLAPAAAGRWLAGALPQGRFLAIEGAAHVPFLSHPAEFERALAAFLDEL
ncbi:MAG TPA: alpha/beta fold hydrolase [Solirubrobacteraceae bacterium]|nr:alpha/beta fold hydrolase [Solirubrobacteraceae bacterium]